MSLYKSFCKYASIAGIEFRTLWAYFFDQVISLLFMAIVMFVFVSLWRTTYAAVGKDTIDGYTLTQMIWYLVGTEAIVLSLPRVYAQISAEIRGGDLALRICKPYHFLLYYLASSAGIAAFRFMVALVIGGSVAWFMVGPLEFSWVHLPLFLLLFLITQALNYCYSAIIGLFAFWTEDSSGIWILFDRLKWMLGGMLLPLEVFPEPIRVFASWLPFRAMLYEPAHLFVRFSWAAFGKTFALQLFWLAVLSSLMLMIFRVAVRRLEINGG